MIYVAAFVACAAFQALDHLEPTWTWITMVIQFASIICTVFTEAPGTAAKMAALKAATRVAGAAVFLFAFTGCSWLQSPQGAATEQAGVDLAVCVLNHLGEPVAQIVTDCGAAEVADVIKIIDAHTAAMIRADAGSQ